MFQSVQWEGGETDESPDSTGGNAALSFGLAFPIEQ